MKWCDIISNPNILSNYKSRAYLNIECDVCQELFPQMVKDLTAHAKRGYKHKTCSKECMIKIRTKNKKTNCLNCDKNLAGHQKKFCGSSCSAIYNNGTTGRKLKTDIPTVKNPREKQLLKSCNMCKKDFTGPKSRKYCSILCSTNSKKLDNINGWLNGTILGWSGKTAGLKKFVRRYIMESRGSSCSNCGWDKRHPIDNAILTEIDHIDGNAHNCHPDNLQILCPNCHSETPNHRARNLKSSRIRK